MSTPYIITFTPINKFFFGSSYSLGEGFYAESLKFPQPTTILGCIRNTILIQNNIVLKDRKNFPDIEHEDAKALTGTSKVSNLNDADDNFGVIEKMSPVFIVKQKDKKIEDILFPTPADVTGDGCLLTHFDYMKTNDAISNYSGRKVNYAVLSERKPKSPYANYFGGKYFWKAYINNQPLPYNHEYNEDEIFIVHTSVGIARENRIAKEGAFYTKIDYSLKEYFSFGVIAWFKEENVLKEDIVILGGEQSTFLMKISSVDDEISKYHPVFNRMINGNCDLFENLKDCDNIKKLVTLSPIVLDETLNNSFTDVMEHRIVNGIHSTRIAKRIDAVKSESVRMISACSVFYPKEKTELTLSWKIPYKIGYNYAIKIKRR